MAQMYYDKDADLSLQKEKKVGVIGFGSQGHAHAQNLKDSGVDVIVGLYPGSKSWAKVEQAGLRVGTVREVAEEADLIMMTVPDQALAKVYNNHIAGGSPETWCCSRTASRPLQKDRSARRRQRVYGRAERPRASGSPRI